MRLPVAVNRLLRIQDCNRHAVYDDRRRLGTHHSVGDVFVTDGPGERRVCLPASSFAIGPDLAHIEMLCDVEEAVEVILVGVRENNDVHVFYAVTPQIRCNNISSDIEGSRVKPPTVHQHCRPVGKRKKHRTPLSNVDCRCCNTSADVFL